MQEQNTEKTVALSVKTGKMTASFRNVKAKGHAVALLDLLKDS